MTTPHIDSTTAAGGIVGLAGTTSPVWMDFVDLGDRLAVGVIGVAIVIVTLLKVLTELQIRRRQLADLDRHPPPE